MQGKDTNGITIGNDAVSVLDGATKAAAAILKRRADLDKQGKNDETLIVVTGENHAFPSHSVYLMLLLEQLRSKKQNIVLNYEYPFNTATADFFNTTGLKPKQSKAAEMQQDNKSGALSLKSFAAFHEKEIANYARMTLFNYLQRNNINVLFNDAARKLDDLDPREPETASAMKEVGLKKNAKIFKASEHGMKARNIYMIEKAASYIENNKPRIVVQHCGNNHVLGGDGKHPAEESLTLLFRSKGFPVLAIAACEEKDVPDDHGLGADEVLFLEDLPEAKAKYDPENGAAIALEKADMTSRDDEAAYVNGLLEKTGMKDHCLPVETYLENRDAAKAEMEAQFAQWKDRHFPPMWKRVGRSLGIISLP